ncbi:hypothetical protein PYCC9005_001414 [Savitreella phatthalungensis]
MLSDGRNMASSTTDQKAEAMPPPAQPAKRGRGRPRKVAEPDKLHLDGVTVPLRKATSARDLRPHPSALPSVPAIELSILQTIELNKTRSQARAISTSTSIAKKVDATLPPVPLRARDRAAAKKVTKTPATETAKKPRRKSKTPGAAKISANDITLKNSGPESVLVAPTERVLTAQPRPTTTIADAHTAQMASPHLGNMDTIQANMQPGQAEGQSLHDKTHAHPANMLERAVQENHHEQSRRDSTSAPLPKKDRRFLTGLLAASTLWGLFGGSK